MQPDANHKQADMARQLNPILRHMASRLPPEILPGLVLRFLFAESLFVGREPFPTEEEAIERARDFQAHLLQFSLVCSGWKKVAEKEALRNLPVITGRPLPLERRLSVDPTSLMRPAEYIRIYMLPPLPPSYPVFTPQGEVLSREEDLTGAWGDFRSRLSMVLSLSNGPVIELVAHCRDRARSSSCDYLLLESFRDRLSGLQSLTLLGGPSHSVLLVAGRLSGLKALTVSLGSLRVPRGSVVQPAQIPPRLRLLPVDKSVSYLFPSSPVLVADFLNPVTWTPGSLHNLTDLEIEYDLSLLSKKDVESGLNMIEWALDRLRNFPNLIRLGLRVALNSHGTHCPRYSQLTHTWPHTIRDLRLVGAPWLPHLTSCLMPDLHTVTVIDPQLDGPAQAWLDSCDSLAWRDLPDQLKLVTVDRIAWVRAFLANRPLDSKLGTLRLGLNVNGLGGSAWPLQGVAELAARRNICLETIFDRTAGQISLDSTRPSRTLHRSEPLG